jgi:hypothetical protein
MIPQTLRVRARGTSLVPNHEAEEAGTRRFIGRKYAEVSPGQWGFEPTNAVEDVPNRPEYVKAVKDGDLWAADQATADACGVAFDGLFGAAPPRPTSPNPEKADR